MHGTVVEEPKLYSSTQAADVFVQFRWRRQGGESVCNFLGLFFFVMVVHVTTRSLLLLLLSGAGACSSSSIPPVAMPTEEARRSLPHDDQSRSAGGVVVNQRYSDRIVVNQCETDGTVVRAMLSTVEFSGPFALCTVR